MRNLGLNFRIHRLAFAGVLLCAVAACSNSRQALLQIDSPQQHLGNKAIGRKFSTVFRLENTTQDDLIIREIHPSCPCISLNLNEARIEARSAETLIVLGNAELPLGDQEATVKLIYSTARSPGELKESYLNIAWTATGLIEPEYRTCDFGKIEVLPEVYIEKIRLLDGNAKETISNIVAVSNSKFIQARVDHEGGQRELVITMTVERALPQGRLDASIDLRVDTDSEADVLAATIPVTALLATHVRSTPESVYLGVVPAGARKEGEILLNYKEEVEVGDFLVVALGRGEPTVYLDAKDKRALRVKYTFAPAEGSSGLVEGSFMISCRNDSKAKITIPYFGIIK